MTAPGWVPGCRPEGRLVAALREELTALRRCLEGAGLVSRSQVDAQLHRQRFADACVATGFRSDLLLSHAVDSGEPARALLACAGPDVARGLRAASRHLRQAVGVGYAGRVPCRTDSPAARLVVLGGAGGYGEELATVEEYGLEAGSWQEMPRLPARRPASAMALLGGRLYLCGGWDDFGRSLFCFVPP